MKENELVAGVVLLGAILLIGFLALSALLGNEQVHPEKAFSNDTPHAIAEGDTTMNSSTLPSLSAQHPVENQSY